MAKRTVATPHRLPALVAPQGEAGVLFHGGWATNLRRAQKVDLKSWDRGIAHMREGVQQACDPVPWRLQAAD
jgi:hypothetical protein